jgi:hypothetical protein
VENTSSHDPVRNQGPENLARWLAASPICPVCSQACDQLPHDCLSSIAKTVNAYNQQISAQAWTAVNVICPYCSHLVSLDHTCAAMELAWRQQNMLPARREKVTLWRRILEWLR